MYDYNNKVLSNVLNLESVFWSNPNKIASETALERLDINFNDVIDADNRLRRFAPLIRKLFPETGDGIIESPLVEIPDFKKAFEGLYNKKISGKLFLKCDSHLKVAGSIKARGGIYEVLKHTETLAIKNGLLTESEDYSKLEGKNCRDFFSQYRIIVGSTGNLGLSIGIMASAIGFQAYVHMSYDAKEWKKKLLIEKGVKIIEHEGDFSSAVEAGRRQCMEEDNTYFIDDENSKQLFLGYSVAAVRLRDQLREKGIMIDKAHPLYVYLPCGVGGGPGGITFGLKHIFSDNAICYFAEPTHAPCMLLGLLSQKYGGIHVNDYGIDGHTEADGLAVGSPSGFAAPIMDMLLDGIYTTEDSELFKLLAILKDTENIKIEPSAAPGLKGPIMINERAGHNAVHVAWATGGAFVPEDIYLSMYQKGKRSE